LGNIFKVRTTLSIEVCSTPGAVFALWGEPTIEDVEKLLDQLRAACRASSGAVVYVARIPSDAPVPSAEVRRYIDRNMTELVRLCTSYHAVMEGSGFVAALKRGVLVSMQQLAGRSKTFFVHGTTDEVLQKIERSKGPAVRRLFQEARHKGLLPASIPLDEAV
jgi:hypothetical protein